MRFLQSALKTFHLNFKKHDRVHSIVKVIINLMSKISDFTYLFKCLNVHKSCYNEIILKTTVK